MNPDRRKIVVIGGVAAGSAAAAKARRVDEAAEITLFEAGEHVSFATCGIPFFVGGTIEKRESLLIVDPQKFQQRYNVKVRTQCRVVQIQRHRKVIVVEGKDSVEFEEPYHALVLATGSGVLIPAAWSEIAAAPNCFSVKSVSDGVRIKQYVEASRRPDATMTAVVVGGGPIGIEMAEAFLHLGLRSVLVEMAPHVLPAVDSDVACELEDRMRAAGVTVITGSGISEFSLDRTSGRCTEAKLFNGTTLKGDLFVLALGTRAMTALAKGCGLQVGGRGGIVVDEFMRTSDPDIFAAGDACETLHLITGERTIMGGAGAANKQGRVAGANAALMQPPLRYKGSLGTAIVGFQEFAVAFSGISERKAVQLKLDFDSVVYYGRDHVEYLPGSHELMLKVIAEKSSGRILGAQCFGMTGVDKRIDVLATAMHAGMNIADLADLDLCYAPQFGAARDPIIMVALTHADVQTGQDTLITAEQLNNWEKEKDNDDLVIIDCRSLTEFEEGHIPNAVHIPIDEMRSRMNELASFADRRIVIYCRSGFRSYLALRILRGNGFKKVWSVTGGYREIKKLKCI